MWPSVNVRCLGPSSDHQVGLACLGYIHNVDYNHKTVSALSLDLCFSRAMCSSFFLAFELLVPN